jgi:hypothetical protein
MTLLSLAFVSLCWGGPVADRLATDRSLTWAGIDCRALEIFAPETFDDPEEKVFWGPGGGLDDFVGTFASPQVAWKRLCKDWNAMFISERIPGIEEVLEVRVAEAVPQTCGKIERSPDSWFHEEFEANAIAADFTRANLDEAVASWPISSTDGMALMVVAERYAKMEDAACVWPVYFDLASREVLWTERRCAPPRGIGFRNYWLNPLVSIVKDVVKDTAKGRL